LLADGAVVAIVQHGVAVVDKGSVVAHLQPGVITNIKGCDGRWCRVMIVMDGARDVDGYIQQEKLWGVYPNETVE